MHQATRAVCNDGAPWQKGTTIIANYNGIQTLNLPCQGGHKHVSLESRAPNGQAWASTASAYWPGFADNGLRLGHGRQDCHTTGVGPI